MHRQRSEFCLQAGGCNPDGVRHRCNSIVQSCVEHSNRHLRPPREKCTRSLNGAARSASFPGTGDQARALPLEPPQAAADQALAESASLLLSAPTALSVDLQTGARPPTGYPFSGNCLSRGAARRTSGARSRFPRRRRPSWHEMRRRQRTSGLLELPRRARARHRLSARLTDKAIKGLKARRSAKPGQHAANSCFPPPPATARSATSREGSPATRQADEALPVRRSGSGSNLPRRGSTWKCGLGHRHQAGRTAW